MKKLIAVMLLPMLLTFGSSPVWAAPPKLNAQEKQLLGKWLCHYQYKDSDFEAFGYVHIEYLADKTKVQHEVSKMTTSIIGETISGLIRYGDKGEWWVDDGRIYDRPTKITKLQFDPILSMIPYWEDAMYEQINNVYDERIQQLDEKQFISVEDEYSDLSETVCQRL